MADKMEYYFEKKKRNFCVQGFLRTRNPNLNQNIKKQNSRSNIAVINGKNNKKQNGWLI